MQPEDTVSILLQEQEILVLMTGLGFKHADGVFQKHDFSRNEVLRILLKLMQKGEITAYQNKIRCADDTRCVLQSMGTATRVLFLEQNGMTCCIYCGERFILCESVDYSPEMLRLTSFSKQKMLQWLEESMPDTGTENIPLTEEMLWNETERELLHLCVYHNGSIDMSFRVMQWINGTREIEISWKNGESTCIPYDKENMIQQIIRAATENLL